MPVIIWINGGFGAGKTTLAEELHRRLPEAVVYNPEDADAAGKIAGLKKYLGRVAHQVEPIRRTSSEARRSGRQQCRREAVG